MDERGISPLIATVVLIAFAVALGAVIMNWGSQLVEQAANDTEICKSLQFQARTLPGKEFSVCYSNSTIRFDLEATKGKIDSMKLVAYTSGDELYRNPNVLLDRLKPGEPQRIQIPYDTTEYGDVLEVQLYPLLGSGKDAHLCEIPTIISNVGRCQ